MKTWRTIILAGLCAAMVVQSGCAATRKGASPQKPAASPGMQTGNGGTRPLSQDGVSMLQEGDGNVPVVQQNGIAYVEAGRLASLLNMNTDWDASTGMYSFGDKDAACSVKIDAKDATKEGDPVQLSEAPALIGNNVYLPVSAINTLLQEEVSYRLDGSNLRLQGTTDGDALALQSQDANVPVSSDFDFGDDPDDPYKNDEAVRSINELPTLAAENTGEQNLDESAVPAAAAIKNIDMPGLIRKSRQYLGVPYIFGASSYAKTGGFDCSLYTQYIYGKYGIQLPRLARQQARVGVTVSRKSLRIGDLVFFYIPGRFKSNKIVGHVGIYIGNGKMINADNLPKKGVQITNIDKPYWKRTFITAKRVAY